MEYLEFTWGLLPNTPFHQFLCVLFHFVFNSWNFLLNLSYKMCGLVILLKSQIEIEPWIKRDPTTCGYLMCLITTFLCHVLLQCRQYKQRREGQGITLIGAGLRGQKSQEGVKIYSAAEAQLE